VALINSIQPFCLHDGPGVRSTVFFKGCPLRCAWCHNPESQQVEAELAFKAHLCIDCGRCVDLCATRTAAGLPDPTQCDTCFECVDGCPSGALLRYGEPLSEEQIIDALQPEFPLLISSGGGITFSGGEPAMHAGFAARLARALADLDVPVALETCGQFDLDDPDVEALLENVALVLFDVKLVDSDAHRRWTGQPNVTIVDNLRDLARRSGLEIWPRMPLIPGINDTPEQLDALAHLLGQCGLAQITLVPYHPMGRSRAVWLGRGAGASFEVPSEQHVRETAELLQQWEDPPVS